MKRSAQSVDELFGNLNQVPLKDVFETLTGKKSRECKAQEKQQEPKWPSVRVKTNK